MSQQYSFPLLDEPDMIAFLSDINFPFQAVWKKPTAPMVTDIYTALVDIVVGIDRDRLSRPEPAIMEKHNIHQDVYARGLPELGMLMMIFSVMEACCVHTFSLRDITTPTWPRLRTILSGVVNFVRFQHEFFNVFEGKIEQTHELENQLDAHHALRLKLQQQYDEHIGSPEARLLKQLQDQQQLLGEELERKKKQREGLELDCRSNASKLKMLTEKVTSLDETLKGLHYELDLLKGRDVTGLLHDVENLRVQVELQSHFVDVSQQDVLILRSKNDYAAKYFRTISTLVTELEDYQSTTTLYKEALSKVAILRAQLDSVNSTNSQLQTTKEQLTEELARLKEGLNNASLRYDGIINEKQADIKTLLAQKRHCEAVDSNNQAKIDQTELDIISLKNETSDVVAKHQEQIDIAIRTILRLEEKLSTLLHQPVSKTIFMLEQDQQDGNTDDNDSNGGD